MSQLVPVLVLTVFVVTFGAIILLVANLCSQKTKFSKTKSESYECGVEAVQAVTTKISVKYYLTAILFILFDIEIIFMYPWALAYGDFIDSSLGLYIFGAMAVFLSVFIFGLFWEIKSRALDWE